EAPAKSVRKPLDDLGRRIALAEVATGAHATGGVDMVKRPGGRKEDDAHARTHAHEVLHRRKGVALEKRGHRDNGIRVHSLDGRHEFLRSCQVSEKLTTRVAKRRSQPVSD